MLGILEVENAIFFPLPFFLSFPTMILAAVCVTKPILDTFNTERWHVGTSTRGGVSHVGFRVGISCLGTA